MRERHEPDLEDQAERTDRSAEDDEATTTDGNLAGGAMAGGNAGQTAGVAGMSPAGPALPQDEDEGRGREEDERLR